MDVLLIEHDGVRYQLTTTASGSSYGVPVLVGPDGTQYGPADTVIAEQPGRPADAFAAMFDDFGPLTALDIVERGRKLPADGETFRAADADLDGYEALTEYGHAAARLCQLFAASRPAP